MNRHGRSSPFLREQEVHGQALASLNAALKDPEECFKNETLVSVGVLSLSSAPFDGEASSNL